MSSEYGRKIIEVMSSLPPDINDAPKGCRVREIEGEQQHLSSTVMHEIAAY